MVQLYFLTLMGGILDGWGRILADRWLAPRSCSGEPLGQSVPEKKYREKNCRKMEVLALGMRKQYKRETEESNWKGISRGKLAAPAH